MQRSDKSSPHPPKTRAYRGPVGGWGSVEGMGKVSLAEGDLPVGELMRQNKADGFMCVSCAWAKPAHPHPAEFCENGAKATLWDLTRRRCTPEFFAEHTVSELLGWSDHDLEQAMEATRFWGALGLTPEQKHSVEDPVEMQRLADALPTEATAKRFIVSTDPDEHVARIKEYLDMGFTHLVFHAPGPDQAKFLELYGTEILPKLRGLI